MKNTIPKIQNIILELIELIEFEQILMLFVIKTLFILEELS
jgi:hypothetical protein